MRCLRAGLLLLVAGTGGGCFTLQNHYSVVDASGTAESATETGGMFFLWLTLGAALGGLALGAALFWAFHKWRTRVTVMTLAENFIATNASTADSRAAADEKVAAIADLPAA